jgi:CrcB protein
MAMAVVAAGGAIGATGRWAIAELFANRSASWEWSTLIVNIVGSLAIGIAARRLRPATRSWEFTVTGVLGGFTTFSAFAVVANDLVDAGRDGMALAYGVVTLLSGIGATCVALSSTATRPGRSAEVGPR